MLSTVAQDVPPCSLENLIAQLQKFVEKHPDLKDFSVWQSTLTVQCKDNVVAFEQ